MPLVKKGVMSEIISLMIDVPEDVSLSEKPNRLRALFVVFEPHSKMHDYNQFSYSKSIPIFATFSKNCFP